MNCAAPVSISEPLTLGHQWSLGVRECSDCHDLGMDWEHRTEPNKFTETCKLEGLAKAMVDALLPRKEVDPEEVLRKHASKAFGVTWP